MLLFLIQVKLFVILEPITGSYFHNFHNVLSLTPDINLATDFDMLYDDCDAHYLLKDKHSGLVLTRDTVSQNKSMLFALPNYSEQQRWTIVVDSAGRYQFIYKEWLVFHDILYNTLYMKGISAAPLSAGFKIVNMFDTYKLLMSDWYKNISALRFVESETMKFIDPAKDYSYSYYEYKY